MRGKRNAKRIARDEEKDQLLSSDAGKEQYWAQLTQECRRSSLISLLERTLDLDGDIVECGVYRGASLRLICKTAKEASASKTIFGLDSFEGFPEDNVSDQDTKLFRSKARLSGKFKETDDVPGRLNTFAESFGINLDLKKGYFEKTLPSLSDHKFCFIHLDCDTYNSHMECFDALYDNLVPGGIIVYDDYGAEAWPGAKKAIEEFLADKPEQVQHSADREREAWYSVKPG